MTRFFGAERSFADGLKIWKFAIFAGLAFTVPTVWSQCCWAPSFPLCWADCSGSPSSSAPRGQALHPRGRTLDFPPRDQWENNWMGSFSPDFSGQQAKIGLSRAWTPYILVAVLLVLTRLSQLPLKAWLSSIQIVWSDILAAAFLKAFSLSTCRARSSCSSPLITVGLHGMSGGQTKRAWRHPPKCSPGRPSPCFSRSRWCESSSTPIRMPPGCRACRWFWPNSQLRSRARRGRSSPP